MQSRQPDTPACTVYVPAEQDTHAVVALSEYEPATHVTQSAVVDGLTEPGLQNMHAVAPGDEAYEPMLHGAHAVAF